MAKLGLFAYNLCVCRFFLCYDNYLPIGFNMKSEINLIKNSGFGFMFEGKVYKFLSRSGAFLILMMLMFNVIIFAELWFVIMIVPFG